MTGGDNFCLWLSYKVTKFRQELQSGQDFCDVTLSCDDNQILSHKVIVAIIYPFGRNIYDKQYF